MDKPSRPKAFGAICLLIGAIIGFSVSIPYAKYSAQPFHVAPWPSDKGRPLLYRYDKRTGDTWAGQLISSISGGASYRWSKIRGG